jgi:hypothetical protein
MAKTTLLEVVQDILSDADGDDVNSITDTVESDQCARVVRDTYNQLMDLHDLEHIKTLKQLEATSGTTPNVMSRPEGFHTIEWVRYDKRAAATDPQKLEYVDYVTPDAFVGRVAGRNTDDSTVDAITLSTGAVLPIINDQAPTFYTIMDEGGDELVFDSYDSNLETNLQASKSLSYGSMRPTLALADTTTFDSVPEYLVVLIKRESRAMFFDLYKDGITSEIDRTRRRAEVRAQRQRNIVKDTDNNNYPDYGRK